MYHGYTQDKKEDLHLRMNSNLRSRIKSFMETNGIWNEPEATRQLIELGLSVSTATVDNNNQVSRSQIIETEVIERTEKITRQKIVILETVKAFFPDDLRSLLTFESGERNTILTLKNYPMPKEDWVSTTNIVKDHKGEWISDGTESHWIIPLI